MSECNECSHCVRFYKIKNDICDKKNIMVIHITGLHYSLFSKCMDFTKGKNKHVSNLNNSIKTSQDYIDDQHRG